MSNITEVEKRYFEEVARALRREEFQVEQLENGHLNVVLDDEPLCEVNKVGGIVYRKTDSEERIAAREKAFEIVLNTANYMRQMVQAPPLGVGDLRDRFKVLADFNGTVLAGAYSSEGVEFVTWDWDFNREGVSHGHYYGQNYTGAKQDFATRAGLISEHRIFDDPQLIEIYRCCADTLDAGFDLTYDQEKCIRSVQDQIRKEMPDIMDRIKEQDQHYTDPNMQEPTM